LQPGPDTTCITLHVFIVAEPSGDLVQHYHPTGYPPRTFRNVKELVAKIENFVAHYNAKSKPFMWTATADSIFEKVQRLCKCISETRH